METWLLLISTLCIAALMKALSNLVFPCRKNGSSIIKLPPGPPSFPFIGNILLLTKAAPEMESNLRHLHAKFGGMITLRLGPSPLIFIRDRSLAHQALVQKGSVFADRPSTVSFRKIDTSNQHTISSAGYGPTWSVLRRNLTSEILNPSRIRSYSHARKWVLSILKERLIQSQSSGEPVQVVDHFRYAIFCLLALMCFGDKLEEEQIGRIEDVQRDFLLNFGGFSILDVWPRVTKILFYKLWKNFLQIRRNQEDVLIPLIRARKKAKQEHLNKKNDEADDFIISYVDTLLDLQLPEENRELNEGEMVSLCSEFLNAGTETTTTALQWIMANLVKYPHIRGKLYMEIKGVILEAGEEEVKEEELQKMPYLKAVILEGLRRHPPSHDLLPHRVAGDVVLNEFLLPAKANINFMVGEMGKDPEVWEDPNAFKPERFLNSDGSKKSFDITGSKGIKMMPFGAGRRICPALDLALLHLEYFVANLVWSFDWKAADGDPVDLTEKDEFLVVMNTPLQARIYSRSK